MRTTSPRHQADGAARIARTGILLLGPIALAGTALAGCGNSSKAAGPTSASTTGPPSTSAAGTSHFPVLQSSLFAPPPGPVSKPDDIALLDGKLWVTYQNNAGKDGTPAGSTSTVVQFDPSTRRPMASYTLLGRCDGLAADPANHRVLASVNEDASSSLFAITPGQPTPTHYTYTPDPEQKGSDGSNGGTDALSVAPDGTIYVAHSNPDGSLPPPNDAAAVYTMTLSGTTATLTPLYGVNDPAKAVNPVPGKPSTASLGLTDPDSNAYLPALDGGTLVQDAQGDSKLVLSNGRPGAPLRELDLTNAASTGVPKDVTPQVDDLARVTGPGTLYVVDQSSFNILAIPMTAADAGKVFVSQPSPSAGDKANVPALSTVDMRTGVVTEVDRTFGSPKGLLFVPAQ